MPLPYPKPNETEDEFIGRCMADDRMVTEFPDETQRYAVCQKQIEVNNQIIDNLKTNKE